MFKQLLIRIKLLLFSDYYALSAENSMWKAAYQYACDHEYAEEVRQGDISELYLHKTCVNCDAEETEDLR